MNKTNDTDRRSAATAHFRLAEQAIGTVFDAKETLRSSLAALATAAGAADPLRAAADVEELLTRVSSEVAALLAAALAATAHATKAELAGYVDTKVSLLFPRSAAAEPAGWSAPSAGVGPEN